MANETREPFSLLFDLDGTLVDSVELILAGFRHAFTVNGLPVAPDAEWLAGLGTPLLAQLRGYLADEDVIAAVQESYRAFQRENHDRLLREYPGVRETLEHLAALGHPMAIVTSKGQALAQRALAFTGLDSLFPVVIGLESCSYHKPHPEPVRAALRALGTPAANSLFVGDSPHDMASGRAAGVTTVAALWGPFERRELERAGADYLLESITSLPALLQRLEMPQTLAPVRASG